MGNYDTACLRMFRANNNYDYPTVDDNSAFDRFLPGERGKLASFCKGVRWALMTSMKIWESDRISGLPEFDASDA
eukprot:4132971-Heterocapsa_arctica.AAC.1